MCDVPAATDQCSFYGSHAYSKERFSVKHGVPDNLIHLPAWKHTNDVRHFVRFDADGAAVVFDLFVICFYALGGDFGDNTFSNAA